jgi:hypothetical protein
VIFNFIPTINANTIAVFACVSRPFFGQEFHFRPAIEMTQMTPQKDLVPFIMGFRLRANLLTVKSMNPNLQSSEDAGINFQSCASCGISQSDQINLEKCAECKLVSYCSVRCQKIHRPVHEETCKRRVAELRDELLFKQPESGHLGDCPICFLPLPIDNKLHTLKLCCCTCICNGCLWAHRMSH